MAVISALLGAALAINALKSPFTISSASGAPGPLFGVSTSDQGSFARDTAEFGHLPIVRVYYPGLPSSRAWTTGVPGVSHAAVVVSFRGLPDTILSGAHDAVFARFFDTAPAGHPIYWSYQPEPEADIAHGQFTLAAFKAAWAHLAGLADAARNPWLKSTLVLMSYDLSAASGRNWKSYLPANGVISTLGWDAYPAGSVHDRDPQLTPPADFMGASVAASKSVGLPFGFAEFGLARQNGRPAWLAAVGNYLMSVGALFGTYFDSTGWPAIYMTDSPSISAWRSVIGRSGTSVPVAPPAPVKSPAGPGRPSGVQIQGLSIRPASFTPTGGNHVTIAFTLTQAADVTVCFLGSGGKVVHLLSRPAQRAGLVKIRYYGYGGRGKMAGTFPVLIVASNAHGSTSAEGSVTIAPG